MSNSGFDMPNMRMKVCDAEVFWNVVKKKNGYKLEQHIITEHARIIKNKTRVAWGDLDTMKRKFNKLSKEKDWKKCKKGDIIEVDRGPYSHFAVYVGKGKVIHYAAKDGDFGEDICIHKADFDEFLKGEASYRILCFPDEYGNPDKRIINLASDETSDMLNYESPFDIFKKIARSKDYHLYSNEETVERAKSKLGESKYSLAFNNCEHFAIWCKTGISESRQVEKIIRRLSPVSILIS